MVFVNAFSDVVSDIDNCIKYDIKMLMVWPNMVVIHINNKIHFPGLFYLYYC